MLNPIALTEITPEFTTAEPIPLRNEGEVNCGAQQARIAVGGGKAWITCDLYLVARLDLRSAVLAQSSISSGGGAFVQFADIAVGLGSAWIVNSLTNTLVEIHPGTNLGLSTGAVNVGQSPVAVAVGAGSVWIANRDDDTVSRVEFPSANALSRGPPIVTAIPVGDGQIDVAVGEDAVWVANSLDGSVSRIDPETNDVVATIAVGEQPQHVAAGEGAVWVDPPEAWSNR